MARSLLSLILCASNKKRGFRRHKNSNEESNTSSERKLLPKINSNLGSKAQLMMVKLISWRKVQAEEEEEEEEEEEDEEGFGESDEEAIWRKTIMMGERCRPLDFSGKILYDCEGNLLSAGDHSTQGR